MPQLPRVVGYPFVHAALIGAVTAAGAFAQAPSHQHYATTAEARRARRRTGRWPPPAEPGIAHVPGDGTGERAQLFMNQGLNLAYAFNHAEAGRAFREAARLDPSCAMAYWGQALVLGPNINAAMDPKDEPAALRPGPEGDGAEGGRDAARTGVHRRARRAVQRRCR